MPLAVPLPPTLARRPAAQALAALAAAALLLPAPAASQTASAAAFVPVTDAMLQNPAPGDWLTWRRTLDGWGFRC